MKLGEKIDLVEIGDRLYMTRRYGVGNTTLRATAIYDVVVRGLTVDADGRVDSVEIVWNGMNRERLSRRRASKLHATHPRPAMEPFCRDAERHDREVAEAKEKARSELAMWRARAKTKKAAP